MRPLIGLVCAPLVTAAVAAMLPVEGAVVCGVTVGAVVALLGHWRTLGYLALASAFGASAAYALGLSPIVVTAALVAAAHPGLPHHPTTPVVRVQSASLATVGTAALVALASMMVPTLASLTALATATLLVVVASAAPLLWMHERRRPYRWQVVLGLRPDHRVGVLRALTLVRRGHRYTSDTTVLNGLDEVGAWVFDLHTTLQRIEHERALLAESSAPVAPSPTGDAFAATRHAAAQDHYARRAEHDIALATELERTQALGHYALAWLEDAVAGLAVARNTPELAAPIDMSGVLERMRRHQRHHDAVRRTELELAQA